MAEEEEEEEAAADDDDDSSWLLLSEQPSPACAPLGVSAIGVTEVETENEPGGVAVPPDAASDATDSDAVMSNDSGGRAGEGHGATTVVELPDGKTSVSIVVVVVAAAAASE